MYLSIIHSIKWLSFRSGHCASQGLWSLMNADWSQIIGRLAIKSNTRKGSNLIRGGVTPPLSKGRKERKIGSIIIMLLVYSLIVNITITPLDVMICTVCMLRIRSNGKYTTSFTTKYWLAINKKRKAFKYKRVRWVCKEKKRVSKIILYTKIFW